MSEGLTVVVGGGAAGIFASIVCAECSPEGKVVVLEKSRQFLSKVRISGGGRCNVTHAGFDPRQLSSHYPRGGRALVGPFSRFQPRDTIAWFEARGVRLKTEGDGRIFPVTDSSGTIIDCLLGAAQKAGVELIPNRGVDEATREGEDFQLRLSNGEKMDCARLMLATGGCRSSAAGRVATGLGHTLVEPVPSLFALLLDEPWLKAAAGVSLRRVEVSVATMKLRQEGALVVTHEGISGPAVLRLSAWGARPMHDAGYDFEVQVNWTPGLTQEEVRRELEVRRQAQPARLVVNTPVAPIAGRLWEQLVLRAGIRRETRWAELPKSGQHALVQQITATALHVIGKSLNKEEFVTCGGVNLGEVNFKTMESRICPGLYFGGELLDIDGVTGGFNFQAAWTTGWIAGRSMGGAAVGEEA